MISALEPRDARQLAVHPVLRSFIADVRMESRDEPFRAMLPNAAPLTFRHEGRIAAILCKCEPTLPRYWKPTFRRS